MQSLNTNQISLLNIIFTVNGTFAGEIENVEVNNEENLEIFKENYDKEKQVSDEQLDTTDMPELESEESAT